MNSIQLAYRYSTTAVATKLDYCNSLCPQTNKPNFTDSELLCVQLLKLLSLSYLM